MNKSGKAHCQGREVEPRLGDEQIRIAGTHCVLNKIWRRMVHESKKKKCHVGRTEVRTG